MTASESAPAARGGVLSFARDLWDTLRRPSSVFALGVLVLGGFVAGVVFWCAFNTAI